MAYTVSNEKHANCGNYRCVFGDWTADATTGAIGVPLRTILWANINLSASFASMPGVTISQGDTAANGAIQLDKVASNAAGQFFAVGY
jgi:hypothetical protein